MFEVQQPAGERLRGKAVTIRSFRARFQGPWRIVEGEGSIQLWAGPYCLLYIYPHAAAWQDVATTGLHKLTWAEGLALARAIQKLGGDTMSEIDKQRVRGVEVLREMGCTWGDGRWLPPVSAQNLPAIVPAADAMHHVLVERADRLVGCVENSDDEEELVRVGEVIEAYEAQRWPQG